MKYKARLISTIWTSDPKKDKKKLEKDGLSVSVWSKRGEITCLEISQKLNSKTITLFVEKLQKTLTLLYKHKIHIWSIINSEQVVLNEEVDLEKLNLLVIPLQNAVLNTGRTTDEIERFKVEATQLLMENLK